LVYFQALYQIKALNKTVYMTEQSEHFINSDFRSLQSDWPVAKTSTATQATAVLDQGAFTKLCCGDGVGGRDFLIIIFSWVLVWSWL
jgi:hypothetical protein